MRVVEALRRASSLPMHMADEEGEWLVKLRGAGGGPGALGAELVAAGLADLAGVPVPARRVVRLEHVDSPDRDPEVLELLVASRGDNLAFRWLPGAERFDPARHGAIAAPLAARIVAFDLFLLNVDRRPANPNLVVADGKLWAVDHEASLVLRGIPCDERRIIAEHVLQPPAAELAAARSRLRFQLSAAYIDTCLHQVPADWLAGLPPGLRQRLVARLS